MYSKQSTPTPRSWQPQPKHTQEKSAQLERIKGATREMEEQKEQK
jgi:hypothetical protein